MHGVRLLGFADTDRIAARFGLDQAAEVERGERRWRGRARQVDSCHTVWFQLHEDLAGDAGIQRGSEPVA